MRLTAEQSERLKREIKRAFYSSALLRMQGDMRGHLSQIYTYCKVMRDDFDVELPQAMGFLVGAGMDAVVDVLGEGAEEDLRNALFELELDGA